MVSNGEQRISIIIPMFNEESNVPLLRERLGELSRRAETGCLEVVVVDDHSSDAGTDLVRAWADEDRRVRLVRLSRNFGSHAAFHAGLAECTGDAAVFLSADLQDPPELVLEMVEKWRDGSDVVWAVRAAREGEKMTVKLSSRLYYATLRRLALSEMPAQGADFFLIDRKVIDAYLRIREKNTSVMCMILWMGFKQSFLPYVKQARAAGTSKWTLGKKVKLFVDSIVSFSFTPIRLMSVVGVLFALGGFGFAAFVVVARLLGFVVAGTGYAALMTVLLVGFGLLMLMLGVMGEYLWRTFDEARGRPRFIVEERYPGPAARPPATGGRPGDSSDSERAAEEGKGPGQQA
jgi:dolichol-phosphate mannosyltransferase